jgi:hypothetical protein
MFEENPQTANPTTAGEVDITLFMSEYSQQRVTLICFSDFFT